ncbi:MAG: hypothetical protein VX289_08330 [Candidatus Poribacteria bacterium]|nr:hypothetical protein [Candidatus Poribacteria bacterium]
MELEEVKLNQLSCSHKVIISLFVLMMGYSYLFALLNLQINTRQADGDTSGLGLATIRDIEVTYRGNRGESLLVNKINGSMEQYLSNQEEKILIKEWISQGRTEQGYQEIQYIFDENCVRCHPYDERPDYPLETYDQVYASAEPDMGPSIGKLARFTHYHAFGFSIFSFLLSMVFLLTSFRPAIRLFGAVLPFVAMFIDITSWWLTRLISPIFAYTVYLGGMLMAVSLAIIIIGSIYDIWFSQITE